MEGIYCLMFGGKGLTDRISSVLYKAACKMFQTNSKKKSVKFSDSEAIIRTQFSTAIIGSISGTKFVADVESDEGKTHVEFLVANSDLDRAIKEGATWMSIGLQDHPAYNAGNN